MPERAIEVVATLRIKLVIDDEGGSLHEKLSTTSEWEDWDILEYEEV